MSINYHYSDDHLGNVRLVYSDLKLRTADTTFDLDLRAVNNYYPFGMLQPGRYWQSDGYRYGFNSMEKDDEVKGTGNSLDFGARVYDSRLGRWLSLDPLMSKYPDISPYNAMGNNPILCIDPEGMEIQGYDEDSETELKKDLDEVTAPDVFNWEQHYFLGPVGKLFGWETSRTLEINNDKVETLKSENKLNDDQLEVISGFSEVIESNKTIYAIYGNSLGKEYTIDFSTRQEEREHDFQILYTTGFLFDESGENTFRAYAIIDRDLESFSNIGYSIFSADGGTKTLPYRSGRTVHEFLDEGLPWIRTGMGMDKNIPQIKKVYFHNKALKQRRPVSPLRNGLDHE
ncbi:RHS repeat-associated core domain-containing protein [Bacteroidota bacterium]